MASAERLTIDAYVLDSLMPDLVGHDRRASAFLVYLYLWRRTRAATRPTVVSHSMIADGTGLAKRSVQDAMQRLEDRGLAELKRATPTSAPTVTLHCHWRR